MDLFKGDFVWFISPLFWSNILPHFITQRDFDYPAGSDNKIVLEEPLLYNLNINPSEKYDIVYKNPDILEKINAILGGAQKNLIPTKDLLIERGLELLERGGE